MKQSYKSIIIIAFQCSGLNDKLMLLLEEMLNHLDKFDENITEKLFEAVREQCKKAIYNNFIKPMKLAKEARLFILQNVFRTGVEKYTVVDKIKIEDVKLLARKLRDEVYVQGLVQV